MYIKDRIAALPGGAPIAPNTPVELRRASDGVLLDTKNTDSNGFVTFQANGSPGPVYTRVVIGTEERKKYGASVGQVGSWYEGEWSSFMKLVSPGVIRESATSLTVVPGSGLQVLVRPGIAMAEGVLGKYYTDQEVSIEANGSGLPRIDLIVMRFTVGGAEAGKVEIVTIKGTPAETPTSPQLTPVTNVAQLALAQLRVQSGVGSFTSADITDVRRYATLAANGDIGTDHLMTGAVTADKLAANAVTSTKIADNAVTAAKIAPDAVGASELAPNSVASENVIAGSIKEEDLDPALLAKINASLTHDLMTMFPWTHVKTGTKIIYAYVSPNMKSDRIWNVGDNERVYAAPGGMTFEGVVYKYCLMEYRGWGWVPWDPKIFKALPQQ